MTLEDIILIKFCQKNTNYGRSTSKYKYNLTLICIYQGPHWKEQNIFLNQNRPDDNLIPLAIKFDQTLQVDFSFVLPQ